MSSKWIANITPPTDAVLWDAGRGKLIAINTREMAARALTATTAIGRIHRRRSATLTETVWGVLRTSGSSALCPVDHKHHWAFCCLTTTALAEPTTPAGPTAERAVSG